MSAAVDFQIVIFADARGVRVFGPTKQGWESLSSKTLSLDTPPSKTLRAQVAAGSALVVVSDDWCGHLQITLPNKKKLLEAESLEQILSQDQGIDTSTYEFAYQRFPVNRETMQVSVSGVEKEPYAKVVAWAQQLATKHVWVMPLSWFVAPLKSIEPALLAVMLSDDTLAISHHYLGVDDARELKFSELAEYVTVRKHERKETHLLYLQATKAVRTKLQKQLGELVGIHPLTAEASSDPVQEVINAVLDKGVQTLAELLHYEESGTAAPNEAIAPAVIDAPESPAARTKKSSTVNEDSVAAELPRPVPPVLPAVAPEIVADDTFLSDADFSDETEPAEVTQIAQPVVREEFPSVSSADEDLEIIDFSADEPVNQRIIVDEESVSGTEAGVPAFVQADDDSTEFEQEMLSAPVTKSVLDELATKRQHKEGTQQRYVEVKKRNSTASIIGVFLLVTVLTAVVAGAVFFSQQTPFKPQAMLPDVNTASPTPVLEASATPTPTPAPALPATEKAKQRILILNSTGIAGLAGKTKAELVEMGWTGTIAVGNATGAYSDAVFAYTTEDVVWEALQQDWENSEQTVPLKRAAELSETGTANYDLVIILAENVEW